MKKALFIIMFMMIIFSSYVNAIISATDINASWSLENNYDDNKGFSDLTGINSPTFVSGMLQNSSYSMMTDASSYARNTALSNGISGKHDMAISLWINGSDVANGNYIFKYGASGTRASILIYIFTASGFLLDFSGEGFSSGCGGAFSNGQNTHFVATFNSSSATYGTWFLYKNGAYICQYNMTGNINLNPTYAYLMANTDGSNQFTGNIDEVNIFHKMLSQSEVEYLYNGTYPVYPFIAEEPPPEPKNYVIHTSQNPSDVNSTSIDDLTIYANISGDNRTSTGWAELNFNIYTALKGCAVIYQKSCIIPSNYYVKYNMTKIDDSHFNATLTDDEYYPGYYPYNQSVIEDTIHLNYSLYSPSNFIRFNIYNFSTSSSDFIINIDLDAYNLSSQPMVIYYCNSSYSTGSPAITSDCEVVSSFLPYESPRYHENSRFYTIPIKINTVKKTQSSYLIFYTSANLLSGWNVGYITVAGYDNTSFHTGSYNSWNPSPYIFDIHIHEFMDDDYFKYNVSYNDGNISINWSGYTIDFYNITNYPPTLPDVIYPCNTTITLSYDTDSYIDFNWTMGYDVNNDSFTYNLSIYDGITLYELASGIPQNVTSIIWTTNANDTATGVYRSYLHACDEFDYCNSVLSDCSFTLCRNEWIMADTPCIGGAQIIDYYDNNSCDGTPSGFPSDNGTYTSCNYVQELSFSSNDNLIFLTKMVFLIFMILMFYFITTTAMNSSGIYKALFTMSGFILIMFAIALYEILSDAFTTTSMIMVFRLFTLFEIIIGIGLLPYGIVSALNDLKNN